MLSYRAQSIQRSSARRKTTVFLRTAQQSLTLRAHNARPFLVNNPRVTSFKYAICTNHWLMVQVYVMPLVENFGLSFESWVELLGWLVWFNLSSIKTATGYILFNAIDEFFPELDLLYGDLIPGLPWCAANWRQLEMATRHLALHIDSIFERYYPFASLPLTGTMYSTTWLTCWRF